MTTVRYHPHRPAARPPSGCRTTTTTSTSTTSTASTASSGTASTSGGGGRRSFLRRLVLALVLCSALLPALLLVRSIQVATDEGEAISISLFLVAPPSRSREGPEGAPDGVEEGSSLRRQMPATANAGGEEGRNPAKVSPAVAEPTRIKASDDADHTDAAGRARRPPRRPGRTGYAPRYFPCGGIDLAPYGIDNAADANANENDNDNDDNANDNANDNDKNDSDHPGQPTPPYRLFESFDLSPLLPPTISSLPAEADEASSAPPLSWAALLTLRRRQHDPALPFYLDGIALRRHLPTIGIPVMGTYHVRYRSELPQNDAFDPLGSGGEVGAVLELVPREVSYGARASHLAGSGADGGVRVRVVRYVPPDDDEMTEQGRTFVGRDDGEMKEVAEGGQQDVPLQTAKYLVKKFKERAKTDDDDDHADDAPSWAQAQVAPGLIVEERLALWDDDDAAADDGWPALRFQCLVLWGRVFVARWHRGRAPGGLVGRDGRVFAEWDGAPRDGGADHADHRHPPALPPWVDWGEVVRLAERVGAGKDMLRVDVVVGVPADAGRRDLEALRTASDQVRREAVKIVVADCELAPPPASWELGQQSDPALLAEAARLWRAGYAVGNYRVVPNTEVPAEFQRTGRLSAPNMSKTWRKTQFTLTEFPSMGVNLATYGMPPSETDDIGGANEEEFELYDNFDIADQITGNENWWDLVAYRRELAAPGLNFYVDKVAQRRWLPTVGMPIPRPFLCRYASELPAPSQSSGIPEERVTIRTMLPQESSYAAKPSHTSCSDGVWLVKHEDGVTKISDRGHTMKEADDGALDKIAASLAKNLHEDPRELESVALKTVSHGFVVEERFTSIEGDDGPAMEFKIFCFWGRVWCEFSVFVNIALHTDYIGPMHDF